MDESLPGASIEIRLHGRGGQGGVTCAKIIAAVYAGLGKSVQTFGDYAGERSGAPVRAYTRVSDQPITNRNKVYRPDHLLILDPTLLGTEVVSGLKPGGVLVLNTPQRAEEFDGRFDQYRLVVVDATAIARRHKIGSRTVVIVNTTMAGAFVRAMDLPLSLLDETYEALGFVSNLPAAKDAYESVNVRPAKAGGVAPAAPVARPSAVVEDLTQHTHSPPTGLKTGSWRTQEPKYAQNLAPCNAWCPAGNDVVGFIQALAKDGVPAASRILGQTTPLAAVCGHVCPAPCMEGCNRREYDGAVHIRGLERWIAAQAPVAEREVVRAAAPRRVAIVGGGPAGLSAAYTLARAGHQVTIFEGEKALGGVLRTGIPEFRLPRAVVDREVNDILRLGVEARCGEFVDRERIAALARSHDAVILAAGLRSLRGLKAPGADLPGIEQGIAFLHRANLGDGVRCSGQVVVLGGGNTAIDCARSALRAGASSVTIAYRRTRLEMPAIPEEIEEAEAEGIHILYQRAPVGFHGKGRVQAVELAEVEMGEPDESGRRQPVVTGRKSRLECAAVLLALGQSADGSLLPAGWELKDGRCQQDGRALNVFAAGDFSTGDGTVTHAIGDGRRAAGRALAAAGEKVEVFERPDRTRAVPITDIRVDHFAPAAPAREHIEPPERRARNFAVVNHGLANGLESHRCFSCGNCTRCDTCLVYCPEGIIRRREGDYGVDYTYCKGCGICVHECPRKAMEMSPL